MNTNPAIRIEKSSDDVPVYTVYRMEKGLSKRELKVKLYATTDLVQIARTLREW